MVRKMTVEDLEECGRVFAAAFSSPPYSEPWTSGSGKTRLAEIFGMPRSLGLVAASDSGPGLEGFILGALESGPQGQSLYCYELAVDPSCHGRGIGKGLMAAFEQAGAAEGADHVWVIAQEGTGATDFYAKRGFRMAGRAKVMGKNIPSQDQG